MLEQLHKLGVSVWLDSLSRDMLNTGYLQNWIDKGLRGQTSNPTIFQGAMSKGNAYDEDIRKLAGQGMKAEQICWELMVADVQAACDKFRPLYDSTGGKDGFVSLELDPTRARDTQGSIEQGLMLWPKVGRPNLMLKVPATREGLPVIRALLEAGCNVNVTLLFAVERYEEVMSVHMEALNARLAQDKPIDGIATVASFFVSRVDTEVEKRLAALGNVPESLQKEILGKAAVANARVAYQKFLQRIASEEWKQLSARGAQIMRPLWASTGVKNKAYPDTLYVDELIGAHCVNTMPDSTLEAVLDHGKATLSLEPQDLDAAHVTLSKVQEAGIDMADVTLNTLEVEGVQKFEDSYRDLLKTLEKQLQTLSV